jgi:hypothetical protein
MDTVKVNKQQLIDTLTINRNEHRSLFLKAQEKYREKVIEVLEERLRLARENREINIVFNLPEPTDYTESYDNALAMLAWEVGDEVDLDETSFRQLVLNQWHWQKLFTQTSLSYIQ